MHAGQACMLPISLTSALCKLEFNLPAPLVHRDVLRMNQVVFRKFWARHGREKEKTALLTHCPTPTSGSSQSLGAPINQQGHKALPRAM